MIAYNHYIECASFSEKESLNQALPIITIEEKGFSELKKRLNYSLLFLNNQGRKIMLHGEHDFESTQKGWLWAFEVKGVVTFYWYSDMMKIFYIPHASFTEKLLKYWALHIVLPVYFTIEERYDFLHAGAVEAKGKTILFTADSFGGKSTMTEFFMKKGHTMISDDKVGMYEKDGCFYAIPSHPHHRPYRKMEDLGYAVENFASHPCSVDAVYLLEKADAKSAVLIDAVSGIEKFIALRRNSEVNLFFLKPKRLAFLAAFARSVPLFRVSVPWDLQRLDEVYAAIAEHTESV